MTGRHMAQARAAIDALGTDRSTSAYDRAWLALGNFVLAVDADTDATAEERAEADYLREIVPTPESDYWKELTA